MEQVMAADGAVANSEDAVAEMPDASIDIEQAPDNFSQVQNNATGEGMEIEQAQHSHHLITNTVPSNEAAGAADVDVVMHEGVDGTDLQDPEQACAAPLSESRNEHTADHSVSLHSVLQQGPQSPTALKPTTAIGNLANEMQSPDDPSSAGKSLLFAEMRDEEVEGATSWPESDTAQSRSSGGSRIEAKRRLFGGQDAAAETTEGVPLHRSLTLDALANGSKSTQQDPLATDTSTDSTNVPAPAEAIPQNAGALDSQRPSANPSEDAEHHEASEDDTAASQKQLSRESSPDVISGPPTKKQRIQASGRAGRASCKL